MLGQRINLEIEQYLRTTAVPAVVLRCHSSGVESWGGTRIDMDSKVERAAQKAQELAQNYKPNQMAKVVEVTGRSI